MAKGVQVSWLADGKRLHLQHGPIDLIIEANGISADVNRAYQNAVSAFQQVLPDLVAELKLLRSPLSVGSPRPQGLVAARMVEAGLAYAGRHFMTPMIAVAGSVADHILAAMRRGTSLERAYVNNGGDIAVYLADEQHFVVAIVDSPNTGSIPATLKLTADDEVGGIATCGWQGRSHSLGIADAVTVLAANAASADTAATLIANAVDVPESSRVSRIPAEELSPDSDLDTRLVTVGVDRLSATEIEEALQNGALLARQIMDEGLISAAFLCLQGRTRSHGGAASMLSLTTNPVTTKADNKLKQPGALYA